ncbi:hypothetical protein QV08_11300 [Gallibacterium salpingitidis]|uniref:peptidylprolyl isomerase n=1 Tax=Gallibacterium salpingitidis TaxID=505341 RepID=A0AB36E1C8_9PAST|nr:peptidylprolyl isomerase [Gallibacterium salpingitidis]OBX05846.1 hypothetical protein QV08_11300 [Gallibacterium salpingitidis]OBX09370.1 hypothetical protein QV09_08100 [Gallibacterium salpingitidis]WKS99540.1 peptidylprolyl isomerase [Gallibacterium salpingitidis]
MKPLVLALALGLALPAMAKDVATVNGKAITDTAVNNIFSALNISKPTTEQRTAIINQLVNRDVLLQEAAKQGLDKKADIKASMQAASEDVLINNLLQQWINKNQVTEEELTKAYDNIVKGLADSREYKVRHIVVKDEAKAKEILADLKANKISFTDAAKKYSIDTNAATDGGELNWRNGNDFIPDFGNAVKAAKKNVLTGPVKTTAGYHIIQVEDERPVSIPSFEQLRNTLLNNLSQQKIAQYVESLREKAKVQINEK